ncbi:MAG: DoxX family protein [Coprobacter sp.]|nr:MAG: DoxX family protein [Coprobacter sp.]
MNCYFDKIINIGMRNKKEELFNLLLTDRYNNLSRFFIRCFVGIMMLIHGLAKISHFDILKDTFYPALGMSSEMSLIMIILVEVGCSFLLILGFMTRLAAIPLIFSMLVAGYFTFEPLSLATAELPTMYMGIYMYILLAGPGMLSLDYLFSIKFISHKSIAPEFGGEE